MRVSRSCREDTHIPAGGHGFLQKGTPNLRVGRQGVGPDETELLGRDVGYPLVI